MENHDWRIPHIPFERLQSFFSFLSSEKSYVALDSFLCNRSTKQNLLFSFCQSLNKANSWQ